uniref:coiled-coil domain-containing protein 15 isoform X5 n=1 Tax=Callithrix jacchus TaxID=9483 RepID=UPI0023DD0A3F|nr:coiled-coil domain-containing protein 15 isoform X5 [Callithrix jacchus]
MLGSMARKKPRNNTRLPLALNPLKSKDVLAVLAERNQAIVPVGAWVEPASPDSSEIPAYTSAYLIEEELKEQLRKKQEALKHFQKQVKYRVNQQIRLRKKQELQKSYERAEKEGSIAMQSSPAYLTFKRTGVFPKNLNAVIGSSRLSPSLMLGEGTDDEENQNELFQQQAQAELDCEEPDYVEASSIITDEKGKENLFGRDHQDQQDILSEDKNKPFRVQKVKFKTPLFIVMEEEEQKQLHFEGLQDILPEAQDDFPEAEDDLLETQGDLKGIQSIEPDTQAVELNVQVTEPEGQAVEPEGQPVKIETRGIRLKPQSIELEEGSIVLETQDFLPPNQLFLSENQDVLLKGHCVLPKDQNILLKYQVQDFLPRDQHVLPKDQDILPKYQDQDFEPKNQDFLSRDQHVLLKDRNILPKCQDQDFLPKYQKVHFKESYSDMTEKKGVKTFLLADYRCLPPKSQDQDNIRNQNKHIKPPSSFEKWKIARRNTSGVPLTYYQSGSSTEFQSSLACQSGIDKEEDKKERQKQYLRHRRLFMDIEREQVKEQQRQKVQKMKIEKIKKKREQERYAEEQRILRMNFNEELYSGEKMSEILAQLQLEENKGAREKQQQREKEYLRYVEALRAQIQEKMQLYNITLPPLCCCGPDFWDAHPDTCANNCIFYKNHKAYTRALHSVINSCDVSRGNSTLRVALHNFASAHRRTLKNL